MENILVEKFQALFKSCEAILTRNEEGKEYDERDNFD